ncbi:apoptosis-inducing factor 3 [Patella vulgata]|uniref:apoptosis-inducing factor 3 n=1 Tax=Patella vulgata TaxID=6465 RepID=UPI0024A9C992|nr:apoptosis-inducing factor 3 [Patella vulgata]
MDAKPESLALRNAEFYKKYDIEIRQGHEVVSVDTKAKLVRMYDGKKISYDSLFIATGGKPRVLPIPGSGLKNVCSLRTPADANFIAEQAKGKDVVVVGSSFIGLEVTAFLHDKCKSVTVIGTGSAPLQRVFGEKLGRVFQKMHEEKGVKFYFEKGVKALRGKEDDILTEVILSDGTVLSADICILGVGVVPATDFLKKSGIELTKRGFVSVNERLQTNIPDVYAGGDIVEFPLFTVPGSKVNIQHWQMAHQHGKIAGYNMNGISREIKSVPYFWTVMYGKSVRYTGYGPGYDDVIVHGDLDVPKFAAFYTKGDNVVAVASLAFDPIVSQAANLMLQGEVIQKSEIISDPKTWVGRLKP